jgi:hypothetical protein
MELLIAGGIAGGFGKFVVAPADRVKTIYQSSSKEVFSFRDMCAKIRSIYRIEGTAGYWRGCGASMVRLIPYDALKFGSYKYFHHYISNDTFIAGGLAGITGEVLTYPIETLRTRISYKIGMNTSYYRIIRETGIRTLYRGVSPATISTMLYNGACFKCYKSDYTDSKVLKGTAGGIIGTTLCYPFEIVKRRMQVGLSANMKDILLQEGLCGLYKGWTINFFKCPVVVTITFAGNDKIKEILS